MSARRRIRSGGGDVTINPPDVIIIGDSELDIEFLDSIDIGDALVVQVDQADSVDASDTLGDMALDVVDSVDLGDAVPDLTLDATADESVATDDAFADADLDVLDSVAATDALAEATATLPDTADLADEITDLALDVGGATVDVGETDVDVQFIDLRTQQDSWTDEGNPNTNHGTDTLLQIQQSIVLTQDGNRGFIAWDFTNIVGLEEVPGDNEVTVSIVMNPPLVNIAAELTTRSLIQATQPWTEGGITWNNQPNHPTIEDQTLLNLISAGFTHTFTLSSTVNDVLGNWLSIQLSFEALVAVIGTFTAQSRENAGTKPILSFRARHAAVAS